MRPEDLESKLKSTPLSEPGITLGDVRARLPGRRSPFSIRRLAIAAAAVWAIAVLSQVSVDHQLSVLTPASSAPRVAVEPAEAVSTQLRWSIVHCPDALDEWLADEPALDAPHREPADDEPRQSSSGRPLIGRLTHV